MAYTTYPSGNSSALPVNSSSVIFDGELITSGFQTKYITIPTGVHYAYSSAAGNIQIGPRTYSIPANTLTPIEYPSTEDTALSATFLNLVGTVPAISSGNTGLAQIIWGLTYGNNKFVGVTYGSASIVSSTNGINWSSSVGVLPASTFWTGLTYGNEKFVAISSAISANTSTTAAYSTDGITWSRATLPAGANWTRVVSGNGIFVALGAGPNMPANSTTAASSTDGITWSLRTLPDLQVYGGLAYGQKKFIAIRNAQAVGGAASSTDGVTWISETTTSGGSFSTCNSLIYADGKWVGLGYGTTGAVATSAGYSTNGINWTFTTMPAAAQWYGLTYGNGYFFATAGYGNTTTAMAISTNGITWTARTANATASRYNAAYGNNTFASIDGSSSGNNTYINLSSTPTTPISFGLYAGPKDVY